MLGLLVSVRYHSSTYLRRRPLLELAYKFKDLLGPKSVLIWSSLKRPGDIRVPVPLAHIAAY